MKPTCLPFLYTALLLCFFNPLHAQWTRQYPLPKLEDVLDIDISSDGYGFAAGANDLLLRTQAGNNQWDLLPGFGEGWRFEAVDYLEGSGGSIAAAGGDGLILTVDKGDHWNEIAGAPAGINTIRIFSPTHIIVAADDDVSVWNNGTWTNLNVNATAGLKGAFILDDQTIWAYSYATNPTIFYTTNGGTNWNSNADVPRVDVVRFYDAQNGIALDGRHVYNSTNGGQNWTEIAHNGLSNATNDLTFGATANVLVAATLNAKPNISTDGGLTWTTITIPLVNQRSYSVAAVSDTDFWMGNDLTGVMHSIDAGATWIETSGPTRNLIQDVYFINRNTGFAIGQKGLILRTVNGGENWEDISFGDKSYLSIHGLNMNDLWMGSNQRIYHSADAGLHWNESGVFPAGSGNINDVLAISANRIIAASSTGKIFLSKNAGMTWDSVYNSGNQMRSIARIDDQHYMAAGFNGVILRSDDQGQTWQPVTIPEPNLQYEQSFFINGEGYLISSSFKKVMWHTTDNGITWDTLNLPIDRFWDGLYFITPDTGVIVGRTSSEGRAYVTFDGGNHWQSGYTTSYPLFGAAGVPNPNGTAWIFGYGSDIEVLPNCNALPVISEFTGDLFPCEKDTVTYSLVSQDVDEFTWHLPPGWQIVGNANNDTIQVQVGANSGNVTVSGSNICGVTGQLSFSAGAKRLPVVNGVSGNIAPCTGDLSSYTADAFNTSDYVWTIPPDWSIQGNANQKTIMVLVGTVDGIISVSGSNTCGTSQAPEPFNVFAQTLPTISLQSGDLTPCPGDTVSYEFDFFEISFIYEFLSGFEDWTLLEGGPGIRFIVGHASGVFQVSVGNECGSSTLDVNPVPINVPDVNIVSNGTYLASSVKGVAYQWLFNGSAIAGATADTLVPFFIGTYTLKVTFSSGCSALSNPLEVLTATSDPFGVLPLSVYPIPASDLLFISEIKGDFTYTILDLLGKIVKRDKAEENQIEIGYLTKGMYLLTVEKDDLTYLAKFIRN
ncbi:MAG TPA: YCF48-related protein [Saprospiraceae bacterium]|nr:YCF48-related protein [Saprospiraceae bacterium]